MKPNQISLIAFIFLIFASPAMAFDVKDDFPKLASYYLQPMVPVSDYSRLAKFDLVILDADADHASPGVVSEIKKANPKTDILAYIPSQSVNIRDLGSWSQFRQAVINEADSHNRWLRDAQGNYIYFSNTWPFIRLIDDGQGWSDFLAGLAAKQVNGTAWDGVFYDMVFANLSWLNNGNIDLNQDGRIDNVNQINSYWQSNSTSLIGLTQKKTDKAVVSNVDIPEKFKDVGDGMMMENFPAKWMGTNGWSRLETAYVNSDSPNQPKINIINANLDNQSNDPALYKKMRFGLASTLLGNGYYSFDSGDQNHAQTWWYDEYNVNLGKAETGPVNLLDKSDNQLAPGLWRRDFEQGVVIVNSTDQPQNYVFKNEEFEKIKGSQDPSVNDGTKINWVSLAPADGLVLLKTDLKIENTGFNNGSFVRVFDQQGAQARNGFFSYLDGYAGNTQVMISKPAETLVTAGGNQSEVSKPAQAGATVTYVNGKGKISVYEQGLMVNQFNPYGSAFKKQVSFVAIDLNHDGNQELITGTGKGGGPQIKIFSNTGKLLSGGFFAYDPGFRGGVNIAAADLNGDGTVEIITGPGPGTAPQVKIFSTQGKLLRPGFYVYDKNYRGGVSVAVGDVNGDGQPEIITGAISSGGPQVKIYNKNFKLLGQFFAYDPALKAGIRVMTADTNHDNIDEILVSTNSFTN